jgi:dynein heavy chain
MFLSEDQVKFQERVELSKQRQRNADDEIRFYNYVNSQTDKVASFLPNDIKTKISEFASIRQLPYAKKTEETQKSP